MCVCVCICARVWVWVYCSGFTVRFWCAFCKSVLFVVPLHYSCTPFISLSTQVCCTLSVHLLTGCTTLCVLCRVLLLFSVCGVNFTG